MDLLNPESLMKGVTALGAAVIGMVTWQWNKMDGRVARLEENTVTQKQFDDLRGDVRGLYGRMDDLKDTVISTMRG